MMAGDHKKQWSAAIVICNIIPIKKLPGREFTNSLQILHTLSIAIRLKIWYNIYVPKGERKTKEKLPPKMSQKVHKKLLDKSAKIWYNIYVKKREQKKLKMGGDLTAKPKGKERTKLWKPK